MSFPSGGRFRLATARPVFVSILRNFTGIAALAAAAFLSQPSFGQAIAGGQIQGNVTDPTGASVPGAAVEATQLESGLHRQTVTQADGNYLLPNLPVGPYQVQITAAGYKAFRQSGIVLQVGNNLRVNAKLEVGSVTQSVTVNANASMVQTEDPSISQVIDRQRTVDLPLNGRQATQLILLTGAAAATPGGDLVSSKNYPNAVSISVAGGQGTGINYLLDGGDNNDAFSNVNLPFPFPDALQEFSVQTTGLSAQYGLHPAGVVNIVTRSGTNRFHGVLFEFLRNGAVNARNYFAATPDSLKRNQFGGTFGGPILRNKLFFFGGYQGTQTRTQPPQTISFVPTAAMLQGDFSAFESAGCQAGGKARQLIDPTTGQPFQGNQIPTSRFNSSALALLKYIPAATNPCGQITYGIPNPSSENQFIGRVDWNASARQSLFGRYFITHYNAPASFNNNLLLTTQPGLNDQVQSLTFGHTLTISSSLLNSLHLSGTRSAITRAPNAGMINPNDAGINIFSAVPNYMQIAVSGDFNIGCGTCENTNIATDQYNLADDVFWTHGRHSVSFGGDYIYQHLIYDGTNNANGQLTFNGVYTGDALADFMLGDLQQIYQGGNLGETFRQNYIAGYIQDNIRMSKRLNINAGLRWEPYLPERELTGEGVTYSRAAFNAGQLSQVYRTAPAGLLFYGDPGVPHAYIQNHWANLEPRFGFAFDPTGAGKESIRGSFTMGYQNPMLYYESHLKTMAPWGDSVTLVEPTGGLTNPYSGYPGGNPFPQPFPPSHTSALFPTFGSYYTFPVNLKPTYMEQWNLSLQRQFGANWETTIAYLGNNTIHLSAGNEQNPAVYIPGTCAGKPCSTTANTNTRRVLYLQNPAQGQYYSTITEAYDGADAHYNALLVTVRHRLANNFTILANYTYSHCLSGAIDAGDENQDVFQNPYDPQADYSNCGFDVRHNFVASAVMHSRVGGEGFRHMLLNNWQLSPILSIRSGLPFTPTSGTDKSLTGVGDDRPNIVGPEYLRNRATLQWINPSAFAFNTPGNYGDSRPYSLYGPSYFDIDAALVREIGLSKETQMALRLECFNCTNKTNFGNPNSALNNQKFGTILSASDPRILQASAKWSF